MRICELCAKEKNESRFRPRGRGRSRVCTDCEDGLTAEAGPIADELPPVVLEGSIEVHAGYGFRASVEDGRLLIEQDGTDEDGNPRTDGISLAPHEVRELFDWAQKMVGTGNVALA